MSPLTPITLHASARWRTGRDGISAAAWPSMGGAVTWPVRAVLTVSVYVAELVCAASGRARKNGLLPDEEQCLTLVGARRRVQDEA